jgi:hypothetical protein
MKKEIKILTNGEKVELLKRKQLEIGTEWGEWFVGQCIQYLEDPNVLIDGYWDFSKPPMELQKCYNRQQFDYYYEYYINKLIKTKQIRDISFADPQYFRYPKHLN